MDYKEKWMEIHLYLFEKYDYKYQLGDNRIIIGKEEYQDFLEKLGKDEIHNGYGIVFDPDFENQVFELISKLYEFERRKDKLDKIISKI